MRGSYAPENPDADRPSAPVSHDHIVQFYGDDTELTRRVGSYIADGLLHGETAIVIATPPHVASIAAELEYRGVAVQDALASGDYVVLDSADTLARFLVDGQPDGDLFQTVVGAAVRAMIQRGKPVRAFGEMVALLWDEGNAPGAIELETMWNRLREDEPFALYCGYRAALPDDAIPSELDDVCALHGVVLPIHEYGATSCTFSPEVDSAWAARSFVRGVLGRSGHREVCDAAELVVAELVANAVRHAQTDFIVGVEWLEPDVRISVRDFSRSIPAARYGGILSLSGRGLHMVGATAARWGSDLLPDGKVVWADLRL